MLVLVYARIRITPTETGALYLSALQTPQFPMIFNTDGTPDFTATNAAVQPFLKYDDYPIYDPRNETYVDYDSQTNSTANFSPLYLSPINCWRASSFVLPKVNAPIIGVIGTDGEYSAVSDKVQTYL